MRRIIKRSLLAFGALIVLAAIGLGVFVTLEARAYDASMKVGYDVPLPEVNVSTDPAVLARGKHLVESVGACTSSHCHGPDLGGGETIAMGPVATLSGPNITRGGLGSTYGDGELARLLRHGIARDGRSVRFMPVQDFNWLPDDDLAAIVSYLHTVPEVGRGNGAIEIKTLGKVLDRQEKLIIDVARHIDHRDIEMGPAPSPTKEYGKFVARLCQGCHGDHFSGGRIPGAPSDLPIPSNLTPDASGLKGWTYGDFDKVLTAGVRKNGKTLDPFMPIESFGRMDEIEKHAVFEYLQSLSPRATGGR